MTHARDARREWRGVRTRDEGDVAWDRLDTETVGDIILDPAVGSGEGDTSVFEEVLEVGLVHQAATANEVSEDKRLVTERLLVM